MIDPRVPKQDLPRILDQGLSKRQIADRACSSLRLASEAYRVHPDRMALFAAVYFISPVGQENVTKIGIAENPFKRLKYLQGAHWLKLEIKALFWHINIDEAQSHEYHSLRRAKLEGLRLQGEWVDLDHREAIGLALCEGEGRVFTDTHGLVHDWFTAMHAHHLAAEDALYASRPWIKAGAA